MKIFIWGAGIRAKKVLYTIKKECEILGFIDSDSKKKHTLFEKKYIIYSPEEALSMNYDYIVISPVIYESIVDFCKEKCVLDKKIIIFEELKESNQCIDLSKKGQSDLEKIYEAREENKKYELGIGKFPIILSAETLLKNILKEKKSLVRFGDGELEIMCERERSWFQTADPELTKRLKEVFESNSRNCLIAVSNNFGSLECYTEKAADDIRHYLQGKRDELVDLIGTTRIFYDAYVSRPYYMYKGNENAQKIFPLFKMIWQNRNILMIEGTYTRTGINNDLFNNAKSVRRIICPPQGAFNKYSDILECVKRNINEEDLILITLGATATVLAYDLSELGYQAIDMGQLDNEYEWYLRRAEDRIPIPGKTVAELLRYHEPQDIISDEYVNQIIDKIL